MSDWGGLTKGQANHILNRLERLQPASASQEALVRCHGRWRAGLSYAAARRLLKELERNRIACGPWGC